MSKNKSEWDGDGHICAIIISKEEYSFTIKVRSLTDEVSKLPCCIDFAARIIDDTEDEELTGKDYSTGKQKKFAPYELPYKVLKIETLEEANNSGETIDWDSVPTQDFRRVKAPRKKIYWDTPTLGPEAVFKIHVNHPIYIDHIKSELQFTGYCYTEGYDLSVKELNESVLSKQDEKEYIKKYEEAEQKKVQVRALFEKRKNYYAQKIHAILKKAFPKSLSNNPEYADFLFDNGLSDKINYNKAFVKYMGKEIAVEFNSLLETELSEVFNEMNTEFEQCVNIRLIAIAGTPTLSDWGLIPSGKFK
jgi:hypothetical protein